LGNVALATGDVPRARQRYREALEDVANQANAEPKLHVLAGCAPLVAHEGDVERAVELLALVLHHPAAVEETRDKARRRFDELSDGLPPAALEAAQARGRVRDLGATMAELSAELGPAVHRPNK